MKCPNCNETLVMTERSGVEIDYCPNCRGVWLDRGELDKIIDRSVQQTPTNPRPDDGYRDKHHSSGSGDYYKKKKRDSFLSDLFDF